MPQPTPLALEIGRLIRVDRAARELIAAVERQFSIEDMRAGTGSDDDGKTTNPKLCIEITSRRVIALWEAVHQVNKRCPGIIYPERGR